LYMDAQTDPSELKSMVLHCELINSKRGAG
jgi:hypothetical protein